MAFSLTLLFAHIPSCAHYIFLCDDHSQERKAKGKERVKKQWLNQIEKHSNSLYSKKQIKQQSYITTRLWLANSKALVEICRDGWSEVKWSESRSVMSDSLWPDGLYIPWNSPGQNTGVGGLSLLQRIPTQGSNPVSHTAGRFFTSWVTSRNGYCSTILL